jgi:hypothetical protein
MDEANKNPMVQLIELLESEERVEWDTVEELVADVPGWLNVVRLLRNPARNVAGGYAGRDTSPESGLAVSRPMRARLYELFLPYSILLDMRFTPIERALRIKRETGKDPVKFGEECLQFQIPDVVEAARAVRAAAESEETLLRGTTAPQSAPEELLRLAGPGEVSSSALLHPTGAPDPTQSSSATPTWLQRLFSRRKV